MLNESEIGTSVNQTLQRAKLLRGAEYKYSLWNMLFTFFLGGQIVMSHNWWLIIPLVFFAGPVQWMLRWLSRNDPLAISLYLEASSLPLVWEPTE